MRFKLIIFDLDGVLVISNNVHIEVIRRVLRHVGINKNIRDEEITCHFGKAYGDVLRAIMGKDYSEEKLEEASNYQYKLLNSEWFLKKIEKIPGLREFLLRLRKRNIKIAIATGNDRRFTERMLRFLNISDLFDFVATIDDVSESKPSPEMIQKIINALDIRKEEVLFVGDSRNDVLAARNSGVRCAVVLTGILTRADAEKLKPDFIIDNVLEVERIM
ncbi:MAG: hypothetical protein DRO90_00345 [Candidatus Altiarchaeales archaeon]|nr:MAG: hypothetical protein DRO90_00345 [Candidatus Altiarchaeales archaeon]